ncbi:MAG: DegT/DnrJ/EryC1/StrS aminotransferase family protein [Candidatus Marinimicrobia bacterium]|jgi:perosamine synthetase|nr:DegT/DnrJ/EryC1/StrS aminotransferase family protein [Candidatus Neomarinimicrobiota bacterium]MBT3502389.1 DegT/DnrJ/EryC1/StrS aminotransferase family protein [Candidatus Neomarinimicrobiota bacterium]MBT3839289.1 DegT/DnrJ/EryC1/StrS aminotransferase family protein [Candidatus Neomarinimicrobiota bacterium]MBT3998338.1 DegT/DnrJ/EryC1/StrS aminotransferase family protein [Candidatus Neomarinimicrobiota bacterium]MBT4281986.1 DegT/DnrJ/EryC1/StrS aminotransferase family protein [Candidatus
MNIPFHRPDLPSDFNEIATESIQNGWLTTGKQVELFEHELATFLDVKHVVVVNSCTAALHLGLASQKFAPGSKFLVPNYTFVSTVECGEYIGMIPRLVDSAPDGFNIDLNQVEDMLKRETDIKAILPVHYGGIPVDMNAIFSLADQYNLFVLEDAAHALETVSNAGKVGNTNHGAAFSFYANKNLTTLGEGGAFATNNEVLAQSIKNLSLHGITKDGWKRFDSGAKWEYDIIDLGYKYNMPDMSASFGRWQLKQVNHWQTLRHAIVKQYVNGLKNLDGIRIPSYVPGDGNAWHLFVIQFKNTNWRLSRNEFIDELIKKGIGVSVHYKPIHMLDYYHKKLGYKSDDFPRSKDLFESVISLPLYPSLTQDELEYIISTIHELFEQYSV